MTTLTDFLLARIAEDEAVARSTDDELHEHATEDGYLPAGHPGPARILAECEAKRQIIETHLDNEYRVVTYRSPRWADDMTDDDRLNWRKAEARCAATDGVVRALAQVYADHQDFDPAWAPV